MLSAAKRSLFLPVGDTQSLNYFGAVVLQNLLDDIQEMTGDAPVRVKVTRDAPTLSPLSRFRKYVALCHRFKSLSTDVSLSRWYFKLPECLRLMSEGTSCILMRRL